VAVIKDPPAIDFLCVNQGNGISPAAVLVDNTGALFGVLGNEIAVNATLVAGSMLSVGPIGAAVPPDANQIGGPDAGGLLRAPAVLPTAPTGAEQGLVTRNIPSGTQAVSAPGGAALALDATLTNGTQLAQVAGTGTAGAPAAGVVTVQGITGGTAQPITDNTTATLNNGAEVAVNAVAAVVLAANAARKSAVIQNTGTANIRVGAIGVTNVTGLRLIPNGVLTLAPPFDPVNAIYAIREGGVDSIAFGMEVT